MAENDQQCVVVKWFELAYPMFADYLISIPKETDIKQPLGYLKNQGFKEGLSSLLLALPTHKYNGLWLEVKDKGKTFSAVQKKQRRHLFLMHCANYKTAWHAGANGAIVEIDHYMRLVPKEIIQSTIESQSDYSSYISTIKHQNPF